MENAVGVSPRLAVKPQYVDFIPLYSYGCFYNIYQTKRGRGKSFGAKYWGIARFIKSGHCFYWVRRTNEELKKDKKTFFKPKLLKMLGLSPDQVKIDGDTAYIKLRRKWVDCCEFCSLSNVTRERSSDNDRYDLMFIDEAFVTPEKINMFRGDEVTAMNDLYISKRREHNLTVFIMGNTETINNPYYQYFGIKPPPLGWEGLKTYRGGTFLVCVDNTPAPDPTGGKLSKLFAGTPYGEYMFGTASKIMPNVKYKKPPACARIWCCFDFGVPITIKHHGRYMYAVHGVDKTRPVFVDRPRHYAKSVIYTPDDKFRFSGLRVAYKNNLLFFENATIAEAATILFERIKLLK